jgi:two-component system, OmpR family, response regulator ResD
MSDILIVDDDRLTRVMLSTILEGGGHTVTAATDGEEALRLAAETHFDLVLLDIWMPGSKCWTACALWRRRRG